MIFQQPNFFGCLEPAPDLAAAANDAGALPVAHVDPISLGVLEAPGQLRLRDRDRRGPGRRQLPVASAARTTASSRHASEFIRRMPGRIVGETVDTAGERGYVLTLQTREQHIRREKATSNITTNQTLLALGGLVYLTWLGPAGAREVGETCMALAAYAKERLAAAGLELLFPEQATFKEFAVRVGRNAREVDPRRARAQGVHPGYALGRDYEGMDDVLLVAVTEKRTPADIDRLAEVLAEVARDEADLRAVAGRAAARRALPALRPAGARGARPSSRRAAAAAPARGRRARARPPLHRALDAQLRHRHRLLPARLLHDEVQPARQRARRRRCPGFRDLHPLQEEDGRAGRARADVAAPGDPRRGRRPRRGLAPAGRRLAGRADRADAHARVLRRPRRGRAAAQDRHPRHRARHEPGERDDGRLRARRRRDRRARQHRPRRPARRRSTSRRPG